MRQTLGPVETLRQIVQPVNWKVIGWIATAITCGYIFYYLATLPRKQFVSTLNKVIKYIVAGLCWLFLLHVVVTDFLLKEGILALHITIIVGLVIFVGAMVRRMSVSLLKYEPVINAFMIAGVGYGILDLFARGMAAYGWAGISGCFGGVIGGGVWATMELYRREPPADQRNGTKSEGRGKWDPSGGL